MGRLVTIRKRSARTLVAPPARGPPCRSGRGPSGPAMGAQAGRPELDSPQPPDHLRGWAGVRLPSSCRQSSGVVPRRWPVRDRREALGRATRPHPGPARAGGRTLQQGGPGDQESARRTTSTTAHASRDRAPSPVAQRQSIRLLSGRSLVRIQIGERSSRGAQQRAATSTGRPRHGRCRAAGAAKRNRPSGALGCAASPACGRARGGSPEVRILRPVRGAPAMPRPDGRKLALADDKAPGR